MSERINHFRKAGIALTLGTALLVSGCSEGQVFGQPKTEAHRLFDEQETDTPAGNMAYLAKIALHNAQPNIKNTFFQPYSGTNNGEIITWYKSGAREIGGQSSLYVSEVSQWCDGKDSITTVSLSLFSSSDNHNGVGSSEVGTGIPYLADPICADGKITEDEVRPPRDFENL